MKTLTHTTRVRVYQSEVLPRVQTIDPGMSDVIAWADENPVVWKIVMGRRSQAFGLGSYVYIGWAQKSTAPEAVLERARHLYRLLHDRTARNRKSIFAWRARFTLEHFEDKGFTGGFFQQHDARYPRSCLTMDYTPETLEEVINRFCEWMDPYYDTARVTVDGCVVRTFSVKEDSRHGRRQ